jgi:hypothetical protein
MTLAELALHYRNLRDDELLQLWVDRAQLTPEGRRALQEEIRRRELSKEAEQRLPDVEVIHELSPPVETYIDLTVPFWWIRELRLRFLCRDGVSVAAKVESTRRTKHGYRSAARSELFYSYEFQGVRYQGRTVRDFHLNSRAADKLAFGHEHGQIITVKLDPNKPSRSYYPSGFGSLEPVLVGAFSIGVWGIVLLIAASFLFPKLGL